MLNSIFRLTFACIRIIIFYLPLGIISMALAVNGLIKLLGQFGFKDFENMQQFYLLFQGLPGLIYGFTGLIAGLGFLVLLFNRFIRVFFNYTFFGQVTGKIVARSAWGSYIILNLLFFISLSQNASPIIDERTMLLEPMLIRKIVLDFPHNKIAYFAGKLHITGEPGIKQARLTIKRKIGAWSNASREQQIDNMKFVAELDSSSALRLGGHIEMADWLFFPYPEIEFNLVVPDVQMIDLAAANSRSDKEVKILLVRLQGPIKTGTSHADITFENLNCPEIRVVSDAGSVELHSSEIRNVRVESGDSTVKIRQLKSEIAEFTSENGDIHIDKLEASEAKLTNKNGAIKIDDPLIKLLRCENKNGGTFFRAFRVPAHATYSLRSEDGDIKLLLPQDLNPDLHLETRNYYRTFNDFKSEIRSEGAPSLNIYSLFGGIWIEKGDWINHAPRPG